MKRATLTAVFGSACLGLAACVVQPPPPVAVAPAPVVIPAPPPPVVVVPRPRPRYWRQACPPGFHLGRHGHGCWHN